MRKENKVTVSVQGMHCRSCELLIEEEISKIPEVTRAVSDHKRGVAEVYYGEQKPAAEKIEQAIRQAGYSVGASGKKAFFSKNPQDYRDLGVAFLFLAGLYLVWKSLGFAEIKVGGVSDPSGLAVVLLVGLTAGISTCMALVGGLVLGISARHTELHPEATPLEKFRPHLFFNGGRIVGYALLGGLLGSLGSLLQFSAVTLGLLTIAVGIVMLVLGIKLTGVFPRLESATLTLPKGVSKLLGIKRHHEKEYSHRGAFVSGALTFFLPCGFTQAMQLYAVSTGSFAQGALIMGVFALGTAPGLLGIGGLTSLVKGIFAKRFFKFAGILVIFLAFFNIANGYNLTGWQGVALEKTQPGAANVADPNVTQENGVQVVRMTESSRGYSPNKFTIQKGVPVKWVIDAQDPYSCAASLMIAKLGIRQNLKAGENVIEFTPKEAGRLLFSCSMGMYTGVFNVVEQGSDEALSTQDESDKEVPAGTCSASAASGKGACGAAKTTVQNDAVQAKATAAQIVNGKQLIKTVYTQDGDIAPSEFVVKSGQAVRLEIDVQEDGFGCMSTVMIPGLYNRPELLREGEKIVMEFTP
ncbi:MAG TPA: sulfite exporter TauE/SafE family protein, partial [Candidatus Moranbacteria bacterium]|nr:sulfite exporter TauE/SafE family protein [Candidatus Moranbacteria bacterium]